MDADNTDLLAAFNEVLDNLTNGQVATAHDDDNSCRIWGTSVVEEFVRTTGDLLHLCEGALYVLRDFRIVQVVGLTRLHPDRRTLAGTTHFRVLWGERLLAEGLDLIVGYVGPELLVVDELHFLDRVRGPEAVKCVHNWMGRVDSGEMCSNGHVHCLLNVLGNHDRAPCLSDSHDVSVVTVDRQRVRGDRTRGDMEDGRQVLSSYLIHIRDHE